MIKNEQAAALTKEIKVVNQALKWLKAHQSPDGSWDCDGFSSNCDAKRGAACTGAAQAVFDAGVTGLALLAFLGAGYDSQLHGPYLDTVRNGLKYLKNDPGRRRAASGRRATTATPTRTPARRSRCARRTRRRKQLPWQQVRARQGLAYINACQNPYKAWRYGKQPGDNDSSVTGWMLMALKAAKDAGIPINERTMKDGLAFIDSMTDEDTGRTGYIKKGELPVRPEGLHREVPRDRVRVAHRGRDVLARSSATPPIRRLMKAGAELLAKKLPVWDEAKGSIDMYYWYYGTLAMFQIGGDHWERWNKNLKTVVIDNQHAKDGCTRGKLGPDRSLGRRRRPRLLDRAHGALPRGLLPLPEGVRHEEVTVERRERSPSAVRVRAAATACLAVGVRRSLRLGRRGGRRSRLAAHAQPKQPVEPSARPDFAPPQCACAGVSTKPVTGMSISGWAATSVFSLSVAMTRVPPSGLVPEIRTRHVTSEFGMKRSTSALSFIGSPPENVASRTWNGLPLRVVMITDCSTGAPGRGMLSPTAEGARRSSPIGLDDDGHGDVGPHRVIRLDGEHGLVAPDRDVPRERDLVAVPHHLVPVGLARCGR